MSPTWPPLPGPLFLFLAALTVAAICYFVHRWPLVAGVIAAGGCLALGWICLHQLSEEPPSFLGRVWVLDRPFVLWGREWAVTRATGALVAFILFTAGMSFLLALPASQGWSFYPFGMGVVAILVLAVTAQQYIYSVLFLWLAANLSVFVLAGGRPEGTVGALRFLALTSLAVMPLLILPRYLEPDAAPGALYTATILMTIGFGILLMVVPFHGQLVAMIAHAAPMVPAFVLSAFSPLVFQILFSLGQAHPPLLEDRLLFDACRWMGIATVALGGLAAMGQRRWEYLVGYATLVDWGAGLVALGQGTARGAEQAIQMVIWRAFSLTLVGTGLTIVLKAAGEKAEIADSGGLLRRRPVATLTLIIGLLSLAAFPLTPGAAGRWPLILDLLAADPRMGWTLILAGVGVCVGTLAGARACLGPPAPGLSERRLEAMIGLGFALLALWLVGYVFLHPEPWLGLMQEAFAGLSFLAL
ncbi:MAG: hypothetical protein ISS56_01970 [Anaerolineae bacterium]|nr:hypothetical protein [Anaerolineae bacterium]